MFLANATSARRNTVWRVAYVAVASHTKKRFFKKTPSTSIQPPTAVQKLSKSIIVHIACISNKKNRHLVHRVVIALFLTQSIISSRKQQTVAKVEDAFHIKILLKMRVLLDDRCCHSRHCLQSLSWLSTTTTLDNSNIKTTTTRW